MLFGVFTTPFERHVMLKHRFRKRLKLTHCSQISKKRPLGHRMMPIGFFGQTVSLGSVAKRHLSTT
jgi:hypothetical protein